MRVVGDVPPTWLWIGGLASLLLLGALVAIVVASARATLDGASALLRPREEEADPTEEPDGRADPRRRSSRDVPYREKGPERRPRSD